jgi:ribosomal protein S18 acetylase RimI-like enzyme
MMLMPHVTYDCQPTAFIEAVVVRYAHRRRGVATLLLLLLSHKRHSNDDAHHLYQALGFAPEAEGFRLYLDP